MFQLKGSKKEDVELLMKGIRKHEKRNNLKRTNWKPKQYEHSYSA